MPHDFFADNNSLEQDLIKVAQYGGVGGQASPYAPGSSPMNNAGGGAESWGVNQFGIDLGLDTIISRTHRPLPIDPDSNMEQRVSDYHDNYEEDMVPYVLSFDERMDLKHRAQIRNRERYLEMKAKGVIPINELSNKQGYLTLEEQNISKHLNKNNKSEFEDANPPQDRPSRYHYSSKQAQNLQSQIQEKNKINKQKQFDNPLSIYENNNTNNDEVIVNRGVNTTFNPNDGNEKETANELGAYDNRITQPFTGQDVTYNPEDGIDQYLRDLTKSTFINENAGVPTLSYSYPLEDNVGFHSVRSIDPLPSPIPDDFHIDLSKPLESNVDTLQKNSPTERLPGSLYRNFNIYQHVRGLDADDDGNWKEDNAMNETFLDKSPGHTNIAPGSI